MFTAYFDGSGSKDDPNTPVLAVAGFIATTDQWIEFERNWKGVCADYGVSGLHMRHFAHSRGEFASWKGDDKKRNSFMEKLVSVIKTRVWNAFASVVILKDFYRFCVEFDEHEMKPYPLAGATCINKVQRWSHRYSKDLSQVKCVFEDGDGGRGELLKLAKKYNGLTPIFLPKKEAVAFQAADLLAYEYLQANKKMCEFPPQTFTDGDLRLSFQELLKVPNGGKDSEYLGIHDWNSLSKSPRSWAVAYAEHHDDARPS